ncbi:DUF58 domain-containing protein [Nakamurella sp. GG22]
MADQRPGGAVSAPGSPRPRSRSSWRAIGTTRRIGTRGLTTRGRCLLAGGVAAAACAVILDERDLLRIGLFAIALPLIATIAGTLRRIRLTAAHLVSPSRLDPGTTGQVVLSVTNAGSARTSTLEISEPPTVDLATGVRCLVPPLRPAHAAQTDYPIYAARRGRFLLGPPSVRVGDPFGLWEDHRTLPVRTEVLVVPSVVDLTGMPTSSGTRSAAADRAATGASGGDPDVGIRNYRSGDDIRTIHWRASARHDELMVRLEEPVSHGGAVVMLDHRARAHAGEGVRSSLETAVSLAASISQHLLAAEHQMRLTTHAGTVLADGRDIQDDVLAALAVLEPDRHGSLSPQSVAGSGLIIAVLGALDLPSAKLLVAARRRGTNGIAFVLDVREWDPHAPGGDPAAVALLRSAGWRVVTVGSGEGLATVWSRACAGSPGYLRSVGRPNLTVPVRI